MIKDVVFLEEFEAGLQRGRRPDHRAAMALFEAMWGEARALGVIPGRDPLEGIEVDIEIARILNSCSKSC